MESNVLENYNFIDCPCHGKYLIHPIQQLGDNLIGIELGVHKAETFCTILQNCPNVKMLYGIDSYQPYNDYLSTDGTETLQFSFGKKDVEYFKLTAIHNIEWSGCKERAGLYLQDSNEVASQIEDETIDFIFLDAWMTSEQIANDLRVWYPKIKKGGLFSGHDYGIQVEKELNKFFEEFSISPKVSKFDLTFMWYK